MPLPKGDIAPGMTFGFWTVVRFHERTNRRKFLWLCRCVCGLEKPVNGHHLRHSESKSCGCKSAELRAPSITGESHYSWKGGGDNRGSLAWCNCRLDSLRQGAKRHGKAHIISSGEDVKRLWQESLGKCMACGRVPEEARELHLDHNHDTGVVRGFLCDTCNVAIGMAGDSSERLRACADYLDRIDGRVY
jgi:hypothetical protein